MPPRAVAALVLLLVAADAVRGASQDVVWAPVSGRPRAAPPQPLAPLDAARCALRGRPAAPQGQDYTPKTLAAGDTLTLRWIGLHGVWKLPSMSCPASAAAPHTEVAAPQDGGDWTFTCGPNTKGDNFYGCPVDGHCSLGMLLPISCNA